MTSPLRAHERKRGLGHYDDAKEVGFDLSAEVRNTGVFDGANVSIARIILQAHPVFQRTL